MKQTYLAISDKDKKYLKSLSKMRTIQAQVVDRARILLYKAEGVPFDEIDSFNTFLSLQIRIVSLIASSVLPYFFLCSL